MQFCGNCGTKLENICPQCNSSNPSDFKFCGKCGQDLTRPKEALTVDYSKPQSYTPKFLADKILTTRSSIEGERKLVTVFFADVANFTSISEKLDPEDVHQIMDGTFKILMDNIHRFEGSINQFTGDGIMALFGAPVAHEDHAQRACHAALAIQRAIKDYGIRINITYGVDFTMRIGLNSGPVVVGSIGDDLRMDYTAVGNTTNLAARLEALAKPGATLASPSTHRLAKDFFEFESLGPLEVKGIETPTEAHRLIKPSKVGTRIGASVAKGLSRFVGRKNSMAALMGAYEEVRSGNGQVVSVVGEAGVGKSRLLFEFTNLLPQDDFVYLEGRCLHYGDSMSYLPVLDILKSYYGIKDDDRETAIKKKLTAGIVALDENLQRTIPSLQELLSLNVDSDDFAGLDPQQKRDITFESIRDIFLQISHDKPLILAIEDLHWIDKSSEEFLSYLIEWLANNKIMLILLYRAEYTHPWVKKSYYSRIGLNQLGTPSSAELIQAILEGEEIGAELKELILNRTSGNPLYIEEFTRMLLENGAIIQKNGKYILNRNISEIEVPDTIQGLIAARIDRLEENIKRTMQVAAVIGREFAYRILQTITGMREEIKPYLANLQGLEFIYEKSLFPELEYIFKHALTQEVAYSSLLSTRRKELHRMAGMAMETHFAERLTEYSNIIGEHLMRGENWEKAFAYLEKAGDAAIRLYAHAEARTHFSKALNALDHMEKSEANDRRRVDTIIKLTVSSWLKDPAEDLLKRLDNAEQLITSLSDSDSRLPDDALRLAYIHFWKGRTYYSRGDMREALGYYKQVLPVAQQAADTELLVYPAGAIGQAMTVQGHLEKGSIMLGQAVALFEKASRWPEWIQAKSFYCAAIAGMGNCKRALSEGRDALAKAKEFRSFTGISVSQNCIGYAHLFRGDLQRAMEAAKAAVEASQQSGDLIYVYVGYGLWAWSAGRSGQLDIATEKMIRSQEVAQKLGGKVIMGDVYLSARAEIALFNEELEEAIQLAKQTIEVAQMTGAVWSEGVAHRVLGQAALKLDPSGWEEAEKQFEQSLGFLESGKNRLEAARTHLIWGKATHDRGNTAAAREHWEKAAHQFAESDATHELKETRDLIAMP
jgi:class 3 adenylate cyclase/tetratricopeptide (TPR) repeat protein/ribosomal protein L40E